jgi:hypothetical protein
MDALRKAGKVSANGSTKRWSEKGWDEDFLRQSRQRMSGCGPVPLLSLFRVYWRRVCVYLRMLRKGRQCTAVSDRYLSYSRRHAVHEQYCKSHYCSARPSDSFVWPWNNPCFAVRLRVTTKPFRLK